MSCQECNGGCCGKAGFNDYGLDVEVGYRASNCKIDIQNSPWWVEVTIDSTRGSKNGSTSIVTVDGELQTGPEIDVLKKRDSVYVPGNSTGRLLEFKIEQDSKNHPPKMENLELQLDMSEQGPFQESKTLKFQRKLSMNP